jgi:hypothetical protein
MTNNRPNQKIVCFLHLLDASGLRGILGSGGELVDGHCLQINDLPLELARAPPEPDKPIIEPWLDDPFPDYGREPVFAHN